MFVYTPEVKLHASRECIRDYASVSRDAVITSKNLIAFSEVLPILKASRLRLAGCEAFVCYVDRRTGSMHFNDEFISSVL